MEMLQKTRSRSLLPKQAMRDLKRLLHKRCAIIVDQTITPVVKTTKIHSANQRPKKKRKPLQSRRKFKDCTNAFKPVCRKFTDYQVRCFAEGARQEHLASPTEAETALAGILSVIGIQFEREKFFPNGDRFILCDVYLPNQKLALEADGSAHRLQSKYDIARDAWLLAVHKVRTIRFDNKTILKTPAIVAAKVMEMLDVASREAKCYTSTTKAT